MIHWALFPYYVVCLQASTYPGHLHNSVQHAALSGVASFGTSNRVVDLLATLTTLLRPGEVGNRDNKEAVL